MFQSPHSAASAATLSSTDCVPSPILHSASPPPLVVPSSFLNDTLSHFRTLNQQPSLVAPSAGASSRSTCAVAPSPALDLIRRVAQELHPDPPNQELKNEPSQGQVGPTDLARAQSPGLTIRLEPVLHVRYRRQELQSLRVHSNLYMHLVHAQKVGTVLVPVSQLRG